MYFDYLDQHEFIFHFTPIYGSNDIELIWFYLKQTIYLTLGSYVPKVIANHQHPVWFNGKIRHELNCLHTLRRKCKSNPTPNNYQ